MAGQGTEWFQPRKRTSQLWSVTKRILEGKGSSVVNKPEGGPMCSSVSAQDLRCFEMEKEKEDASSPRGVLEACMRGDLDDTIDDSEANHKSWFKTLSSRSRSSSNSPSHWQKFFKLWRRSSVRRSPSFQPPLSKPKISTRKSRSARESTTTDFDLSHFDYSTTWLNFSLSDLKAATNNFNKENLIGKGGYAQVYKGCLPNGRLVAIKRLNKGTAEEQVIDFLSEIGTIAHVNHPNTVKLIGYGVEGGTYLVLELSPLGSLGSILRGAKEKLDWGARHKIIVGIANGLLYLHDNCRRRIIHRDIKADNILLTEDFEPQICDFGLAKWLPKQWTHHNVSKFEGTFGYFAPEYFMHGIVDEKTDVFSYGVLVLELISGRQALDDSQNSLVLWARPLLAENAIHELIDPCLGDSYNRREMERAILTASLCIEHTPLLRPQMSQVILLLKGDASTPEPLKSDQKWTRLRRTYSEELFDAEEYNSTKHLNNLKRFEQPTMACCGYGGPPLNYDSRVACGQTKTLNSSSITASGCNDTTEYVIWDGIHYTEAANQYVASQILTGKYSDPPFSDKMPFSLKLKF